MAMSSITAHRVIVGLYTTGIVIGIVALLLLARNAYVTMQFYEDMVNKDPKIKARYEQMQKEQRAHFRKMFWL